MTDFSMDILEPDKAFKKTLYGIMNVVGGKIKEFFTCHAYESYFIIGIEISFQDIYIFYNPEVRCVAFSTTKAFEIMGDFEFGTGGKSYEIPNWMNVSELEKLFASFYKVYTVEMLVEPLRKRYDSTNKKWYIENEVEIDEYDLKYWNPETVADVLFNNWD